MCVVLKHFGCSYLNITTLTSTSSYLPCGKADIWDIGIRQ